MRKSAVYGAVSLFALGALLATPSYAQQAGGAGEASARKARESANDLLEEVVVTGSRVATNGFQAPTPVTTVSAEQLRDASPNLTEALRRTPQLYASSSPQRIGGALGDGPSTFDSANLRSLGVQRTLTLLDGRRPPVVGSTGASDMGQFPLQLVKRVDVVTGGASAVYGSDAVAGVVNFILDTDFKGLKMEAYGGISSRGDSARGGLQVSAGGRFLDDRLKVIANFSASSLDGLNGDERKEGRALWGAVPNPAAGQPGQPNLLLRSNVRQAGATFGGLITSAGPLRDIQFDATGNPVPFTPGTLRGVTLMVGGDGAGYSPSIGSDFEAATGFVHADFALSNAVDVFAEASYGDTHARYDSLYPFDIGGTAYTIRSDNAYLPASIRTVMQQNNIASFQLGKVDINYPRPVADNRSQTLNTVVGVKVALPRDFKLDAYLEHGEVLLRYSGSPIRIQARSRLAADAVVNPATGAIVCRSTLTAPTNGCVPLSPFGTQPLSEAQLAYLTSGSRARSLTIQNVAAFALRGELFSTWAGPVTAAAGAEYREVRTSVTTDAISRSLGFTTGNLLPSRGSYDVKEAFGEVLVPLARDMPLARNLDLNAAIRRTDYSTSGGVTTYKIGLTDEVIEGLRLRATYSRDIRAPNIGELFGGVSRSVLTVRDPRFGGAITDNFFVFTGSNPNLDPERANTKTIGAVYRPPWLPGLGASVDYFSLDIKGAIATLTPQQIVDQCATGNQDLCGLITRGPNGQITELLATAQNVQTAKIAGVDFEVGYQGELLGGTYDVRGLATYLDTYRFITPGAAVFEQAGAAPRPKWRGNVQATYQNGPWRASIAERYIGGMKRFVTTTIDDNHMAATWYTDVSARYRFEDPRLGDPEVFLNIQNLFDQGPRVGPTSSCSLGQCTVFDYSLYDLVGRAYSVGIRARF